VGRILLRETEAEVRRRGGTRLYAETSGRPQYAATRAFYERTGFDQAEVLADFYDVGDARVTYCKVMASCFPSS
jgi:ribosomal protein S18 acetylase RimI-like enzyme